MSYTYLKVHQVGFKEFTDGPLSSVKTIKAWSREAAKFGDVYLIPELSAVLVKGRQGEDILIHASNTKYIAFEGGTLRPQAPAKGEPAKSEAKK